MPSSFFEVAVEHLEAQLGDDAGWCKSPYADREIRFSKAGQRIVFVVRNSADAPRLKAVQCWAVRKHKSTSVKKTTKLSQKVTFVHHVQLRVRFEGYHEAPAYDGSGQDAMRAFVESVLMGR